MSGPSNQNDVGLLLLDAATSKRQVDALFPLISATDWISRNACDLRMHRLDHKYGYTTDKIM